MSNSSGKKAERAVQVGSWWTGGWIIILLLVGMGFVIVQCTPLSHEAEQVPRIRLESSGDCLLPPGVDIHGGDMGATTYQPSRQFASSRAVVKDARVL